MARFLKFNEDNCTPAALVNIDMVQAIVDHPSRRNTVHIYCGNVTLEAGRTSLADLERILPGMTEGAVPADPALRASAAVHSNRPPDWFKRDLAEARAKDAPWPPGLVREVYTPPADLAEATARTRAVVREATLMEATKAARDAKNESWRAFPNFEDGKAAAGKAIEALAGSHSMLRTVHDKLRSILAEKLRAEDAELGVDDLQHAFDRVADLAREGMALIDVAPPAARQVHNLIAEDLILPAPVIGAGG